MTVLLFGLGITQITSNLGMSFESIVLLLAVIGGLLFYVVDFKIGMIINWFISGLIFAWFYYAHWNYTPALIVFLSELVIMALGLYFVSKAGSQGAVQQ